MQKYYFLTPVGPIYLPIKYWNFAQSPFKKTVYLMEKWTTQISIWKYLLHRFTGHLSAQI